MHRAVKTGQEEVTSIGLPADFTGLLDQVIGSGLNTSHNAHNVVDVYCKSRTSAFYKVVWQHRSGKVGSEYTT